MRFSVVVPNLHTPNVDQAVESLERQAFERAGYEVIVVGLDKYKRVRESDVVRFDRSEQALSPAQARNRGAAQARGEIVAFTDADCAARPAWLAVLAERFDDPAITVVGGGVEFDTGTYWSLADNLSMFHDYLAVLPPGQRRQLPSLNLAVRREVFAQVGGFDERYPRAAGEDADLTIRLRQQGHILYFEPRAIVFHAPARSRLVDVWRHAFYQGKYSSKVDPRYASREGLAWPLRTRWGVTLAAPLLALAVTARILMQPHARRYWRTAPAIVMAKIAWCLGAACRP